MLVHRTMANPAFTDFRLDADPEGAHSFVGASNDDGGEEKAPAEGGDVASVRRDIVFVDTSVAPSGASASFVLPVAPLRGCQRGAIAANATFVPENVAFAPSNATFTAENVASLLPDVTFFTGKRHAGDSERRSRSAKRRSSSRGRHIRRCHFHAFASQRRVLGPSVDVLD
jgi:hypothetical protein